jgi:Fur family ferric uptake transcriptional regulator
VRAELGDHVWRFEWRKPEHDNADWHPHFVCVDCGNVTCVRDFELEDRLHARRLRVGKITEVLFRGHCAQCADGA